MELIERQKNQAIVIDGHVRVTVIEVHEDEVIVSIESGADPSLNRIETMRLVRSESELELAGAPA